MTELFGIQIAAWLTTFSALAVWLRNPRVWQLLYAFTIASALFTSSLSAIALLPMIVFLGLIYAYIHIEGYQEITLLSLIATSLVFGLHVLPGFNNQEYLSSYQLNPQSAPFSIWFNYDKSMVGLILLGTLFHPQLLRGVAQWATFAKELLPIVLIGIPAIYSVGLILGYAHIDWTPVAVFWPWALKNLFFTVIAEELVFRGLIQRELSKRLKSKHSQFIAIAIAASLFGLAHFAGGVEYIVLSTLAGLVYGYAYYKTQRIEGAILAHFILNAAHFIFFSYPFYLSSS